MTGQWRKSTRSQPNGANCVETRISGGRFEVRDSKLGDDSPVFGLAAEEFSAFLHAARR